MREIQPVTSLSLVFIRVFWMGLGPAFCAILAVNIANHWKGWFTPTDFAFFIVLGGLPIARWLEFRAGDPTTSTGEPATPAHLRRYVITTLALGLGAWVFANLLGNHWFSH